MGKLFEVSLIEHWGAYSTFIVEAENSYEAAEIAKVKAERESPVDYDQAKLSGLDYFDVTENEVTQLD